MPVNNITGRPSGTPWVTFIDECDADSTKLSTFVTGLQLSTLGVTLGSNVAAFLAAPTSANLRAALTDESGSSALVFATSPTLVTPALGAATATSINKVAITAPATSSTLTVADGKTLTASNTLTLAGTDSTTMTFPATSATIARTDAANTFTGHQTIEGVTSTGATGTGAFVFATSPTLVTPNIGVATATSVNKLTLTAPATSATLTITDGKTVAVTNTLTLSGTDGTTMTFPSTSATIARTDAANTFTGVQTMTSPVLVTPAIGVATGASLAVTAGLTSSGSTGAGIGYVTGAGGTVTQATNRTTGVTLSKLCGQITTNNASLAAGAAATFTVTNTTVAATDTIRVTIVSGTTTVQTTVYVSAVGAGSFGVTVNNGHASTAETGAIVFNYAIFKSVSA